MKLHVSLLFTVTTAFYATVNAFAAPTVRISGLNDMSLGSWNGFGDLSDEDPICVYKSTDTNYKISAIGNGSGSSFALVSSGSTIPYEIYFKGATGSYVQLTANALGASFTGANISVDDCGGATNASIKVVVTETELGKVLTGSYSGTITILLEPS